MTRQSWWTAVSALLLAGSIGLTACDDSGDDPAATFPAIARVFAGRIDPNNLPNYANQAIPAYITKRNSQVAITDAKATLGRVLFYDRNLSTNNTISCASCHQQANAFGDPASPSIGVNGSPGRHSMRLINARFADEVRFFWDERAATLEAQSTQPIRDHAEMGFSGTSGAPGFSDLIAKLNGLDYYRELFTLAYGDASISEARMQEALASFVRSIQSFDSKYDQGRAQVANDGQPFPNFTQQENQGKQLFLDPPQFGPGGQRVGGGLGCQPCHRAPEFDISPASLNNGVIGTLVGGGTDLTNTRSPSLRDMVKADGTLNTPLMHTGSFVTLERVLDHYANQIQLNNNLDPRLRPAGNPLRLNLTTAERDAVVAFLKTLRGSNVYTDSKWSNPF